MSLKSLTQEGIPIGSSLQYEKKKFVVCAVWTQKMYDIVYCRITVIIANNDNRI